MKTLLINRLGAIAGCLLATAPLNLQAQVVKLAEYDFEQAFVPVQGATSSGSLPVNWLDASTGDATSVVYSALRETPFAGAQSLLLEHAPTEDSVARLLSPVIDLSRGEVLRVRLALRSPTNAEIELQLTAGTDPGEVLWRQSMVAVPEWTNPTLLIPIPGELSSGRMVLVQRVTGRLETDNWSFESLNIDDLTEERDFAANLLPISAFPLGATAPYNPSGHYRPDTAVVADLEVTGPSGQPALRLSGFRSEWNTQVRLTVPFTGRPLRSHTFSFWTKGSSDSADQTIAVQLGMPTQMQTETIPLSGEWTRHSITVDLPFSSSAVYLARITGNSTAPFWIDGLRVAEGADLSSYERAGPVELSANPTVGSGLFFEGEPFSLDLALWGDLQAITGIEGELRHADGRTFEMPLIAIDGSGIHSDTLRIVHELPQAGLPEFGTFVLALRAVDAVGVPLSKWSETLLHRVRVARYADRMAPDSPFGTHIFWTEREATRAKALGFNWLRANYKFAWSSLEPNSGDWQWDLLDGRIAHPLNAKLKLLAYLSSAPRWASTASDEWTGNNVSWWRFVAPPRNDPETLDAFETYAFNIFSRYGDDLDAVETWNEPFLAGFFPSDVVNGAPQRAPAELLNAMTQRIRRAADTAGYDGKLIWNIGATYGASERAFDEANISIGTDQLVDGYSVHRYTQNSLAVPGDQAEQDYNTVREVFTDIGAGGKALWNSEGGTGPTEIFNLYAYSPPRPNLARQTTQAQHFVRFYIGHLAAGFERIFSYAFFEQDGWQAQYSYMHADGCLSHVATAFSNMAWHLEDMEFAGYDAPQPLISAYRFSPRNPGREPVTVVFLSAARSILTALPDKTEVRDLYGNPITPPAIVDRAILYLSSENTDTALAQLSASIVSARIASPFNLFTDQGDSWRQTYLGRINDAWWPWLQHQDMGMLYAVPASSSQELYLHDYATGRWWFMRSSTFPWLYDYASERWIWYVRTTQTPDRWFWLPGVGTTQGQWLAERDLNP